MPILTASESANQSSTCNNESLDGAAGSISVLEVCGC